MDNKAYSKLKDDTQLGIVYVGKATSTLYKKDVESITITIKGQKACVSLSDRQWYLNVIDELGSISLLPIDASHGLLTITIEKTSFGGIYEGKYASVNHFDVGMIEVKRTPIGELEFFKKLMGSSKL